MLNTFRQIGVSLGTAVLGAVVLLQFSGNINAHLIQRGVPASASAAIASKIAGAGAQASHAVLGSHLPLPAAIMRQVISQSFVDALHSSFLISAVIMVVIAAMFTLLIGRIKPQAARQPEKVVPVAPVANPVEV
jgi:phosphate/sulfate permease